VTPFSNWSNDNGRLIITCQEVMGDWLDATCGLYKLCSALSTLCSDVTFSTLSSQEVSGLAYSSKMPLQAFSKYLTSITL
jgi:hypothetical protein